MAIGFDREDLHAPMAEINTTPLVDVMLVLLVILLVTAPLLTHAVKLELPRESSVEVQDPKAAILSVNAAGDIFWDEKPVTDAALEQMMRAAATATPPLPLHIRADSAAAYGKISHVLSMATRTGLTNIGFLTEPNLP